MIICFSGTGNSALVAQRLAEALGDGLVMIDRAFYDNPVYREDEPSGRLMWVFPVYSWGVPPVVLSVIERIGNLPKGCPTWMVATCGDDAGYTDRMWRRAVESRGMTPIGAYTLFMPNTYVCMKGFDVDGTELALDKEKDTIGRLPSIVDAIGKRERQVEVTRGSFAWFKTTVIYPWFVKNMMKPSRFHVTDSCSGCGLCARRCPMDNIKMEGRRPVWSSLCAFCLRCYHRCPSKAVQWGSSTIGKGQYPGPMALSSAKMIFTSKSNGSSSKSNS